MKSSIYGKELDALMRRIMNMKCIVFTIVFAIFLTGAFSVCTPIAEGVPVAPIVFTHVQSDGSVVYVWPVGDEFLYYTIDANGELVVLGDDGDLYYANWARESAFWEGGNPRNVVQTYRKPKGVSSDTIPPEYDDKPPLKTPIPEYILKYMLKKIQLNYSPMFPTIFTVTLPRGSKDTYYNRSLDVRGFITPVTWTLDNGKLPDGLNLSDTGVISGTPTSTGTFSFTVKATNTTGNDTQALSIVVSETDLSITPATGWSFAGNTFTITANGNYTISGTSTTNVIVVSSGLTNVNISLTELSIDVSGMNNACAFSTSGAVVNLTLVGDNTLKSSSVRAGLEAPEGSTLKIDGDGSLTAVGGNGNGSGKEFCGNGIGGGGSSANTITINGGVVNAASSNGVGIGGGTITINDGVVNAASVFGIGIGGGTIIINGGVITAMSGNPDNVAGVDGGVGISGNNGTIIINGGVTSAKGGVEGKGIEGGTITINNSFVGASGGAGIIGDTITIISSDIVASTIGGRNASNTITIIGGNITTSVIGLQGLGGTITIIGGNITSLNGIVGYDILITDQPAEKTLVTANRISGSLSVTASVTPSETLSYQWYSNTTNNNSGGVPVSGAIKNSFAIPTNLPMGTRYYYCVVSCPLRDFGGAVGVINLHSNVAEVAVTQTATSGKSGCNAGYGILALVTLMLFVQKQKLS